MFQPATALHTFLQGLPKAELHLHIEGTLEPELIFELAERNHIPLTYPSVDALRAAYQFQNLQSFLDLYYAGASVLIHEADFYAMTMAYFTRIHADGVTHTEIMFDPQTHTARGIAMETIFSGIASACRDAQKQYGISSYLILSFLRHLSEEDAFKTLEAALPLHDRYSDLWVAIGLDSAEQGNPPEKFAKVYQRCKELGFRLVAHAGEEGPAHYITTALDLLKVERVDHGVRSEDDPQLVQRLATEQIALTVCPLSNLKLKVFETMHQHNLASLLRQGVKITINSDDPSYFGGYLLDNYLACAQTLALSREELVQIAINSFTASFLPEATQREWVAAIQRYAAEH